jgi:mannose PTS system EIID component
VAVLLTYNAIHFLFRAGLFLAGYRRGDQLVVTIARLSLPVAADRLRAVGAGLCGASAAIFLFHAGAVSGSGAAGLAALAAGVGYVALARGARLLPTAYVATLMGIGAALLLGHLHGSN